MRLHKYRWSNTYESAEEDLIDILESKNIPATRKHFDTQTSSSSQLAKVDTQIWCAEGSLTVSSGGKTISLQPGDALIIPTNTTYTLESGYSGCAIYTSA